MKKWFTVALALTPMILLILFQTVNIDLTGYAAKRQARDVLEAFLAMDSYAFRVTKEISVPNSSKEVQYIEIIEEADGYGSFRESHSIELFTVDMDEAFYEYGYIMSKDSPAGLFFQDAMLVGAPWVIQTSLEDKEMLEIFGYLKQNLESGLHAIEFIGESDDHSHFRIQEEWPIELEELQASVYGLYWGEDDVQEHVLELMDGAYFIEFAIDQRTEKIESIDLTHSSIGVLHTFIDRIIAIGYDEPFEAKVRMDRIGAGPESIEIPDYLTPEEQVAMHESQRDRPTYDELPHERVERLFMDYGHKRAVVLDTLNSDFEVILYSPNDMSLIKLTLNEYLDETNRLDIDLSHQLAYAEEIHFPVAPPAWSERLPFITRNSENMWFLGSYDKKNFSDYNPGPSLVGLTGEQSILDFVAVKTMKQVGDHLYFMDGEGKWYDTDLKDPRGLSDVMILGHWPGTEINLLDTGGENQYFAFNPQWQQMVYLNTSQNELKKMTAKEWEPDKFIRPEDDRYSDILKSAYDQRYFIEENEGRFTIGQMVLKMEDDEACWIIGYVMEQDYLRRDGAYVEYSQTLMPVMTVCDKKEDGRLEPKEFVTLEPNGDEVISLDDLPEGFPDESIQAMQQIDTRIPMLQYWLHASVIDFAMGDQRYPDGQHVVIVNGDQAIIANRE